MALTKTVTKVFPTNGRVGIHLKLEDDTRLAGEQVVIDLDFTESFTRAVGMAAEVEAAVQKAAQEAIDKYKQNKQAFDAQAYTDAVGRIDSALDIAE